MTKRSLAIAALSAAAVTTPLHADAPPTRDNLAALIRAAGLVQHFHPTDQSETVDWSAFLRGSWAGVATAEGPEALAAAIGAALTPLAPSMQVFPTEAPPAPPKPLLASAEQPFAGVQFWRHIGFTPLQRDGLFARDVMLVGLRNAEALRTTPDPTKLRLYDLGGGVSCRLAVSVWVDAKGRTLPLVEGSSARGGADAAWSASRASLDALTPVALVWNAVQHFSPAFIDAPPTLRPDWDGALLRAIDEALALEPGADPLGPCRGMLAALHDAQATVEFAEDGAWAPVRLEWVDGRALVTHADADAGLRIGDRILKVDGVEAGAWVERAMSRAPGARDDVRERVGLALGMLGPHGSTIEVRASRRGGSGEEDVRLTRRFKSTTAGDVREVAPGVLYVDPSTFTDESFIEALRGPLSEADAVIVDYRSLGMGGLHRHLGSFIAGGAPVMTRLVPTPLYPNREEMALTNMEALLTPNHPHIAAKLIVLADAGTRSDPELDVMFVKRFKLGTIVGERTAGAAGPPAVYEFDDMGRRIVATWTAAGTTLDGTTAHFTRGVEPDVEVRPTAAGLGAGRDEALEEAIRIAQAR